MYFAEGAFIGALIGLYLRPVLDSYVLWHRAKALASQELPEPALHQSFVRNRPLHVKMAKRPVQHRMPPT